MRIIRSPPPSPPSPSAEPVSELAGRVSTGKDTMSDKGLLATGGREGREDDGLAQLLQLLEMRLQRLVE